MIFKLFYVVLNSIFVPLKYSTLSDNLFHHFWQAIISIVCNFMHFLKYCAVISSCLTYMHITVCTVCFLELLIQSNENSDMMQNIFQSVSSLASQQQDMTDFTSTYTWEFMALSSFKIFAKTVLYFIEHDHMLFSYPLKLL